MLSALVYVILFMVLPALPMLPVLLKLLVGLLWPCFLVLVIGMFREADGQRDTELGDMFDEIKPQIGKLVALGGVCLVYGLLVSWLTKGDVDALEAMGNTQVTPEAVLTHLTQSLPLVLKLILLLSPLLMATWFSPMLIAFENYPLPKAIKSSLAGCLQYLVALGAGWLMVTVFMMLGMMTLGLLVGMLAAISETLGLGLMSLVLFGSLLMATAWMLAFQYVSYRDVYKISRLGKS
jgi:hypothetical protein